MTRIVIGYALGWLALASMLAITWAGFRHGQRKHRRRMAESEAARWARLHGGDPEYGGALRRQRMEVVQSGGELRARLIDASVERVA